MKKLASQKTGVIELNLVLLISLILILLAIIVLFPYWRKVITASERVSQVQACKTSISLFSTVSEKTLGNFKPLIKCPAPHMDISGDKDAISSSVAESIATCWDKTNGRSNRITTADEPIRNSLGLNSGDSLCILCSSFTVSAPTPVKEITTLMQNAYKHGTVETYAHFLDTAWNDVYGESLGNIFLSTPQPGVIPLPEPLGTMEGAQGIAQGIAHGIAHSMELLESGTTYYIIDYSKQEKNTVVITTQAQAGNIACDRFIQQREPGSLLTTTRLG